jgi:hypothetical protein
MEVMGVREIRMQGDAPKEIVSVRLFKEFLLGIDKLSVSIEVEGLIEKELTTGVNVVEAV